MSAFYDEELAKVFVEENYEGIASIGSDTQNDAEGFRYRFVVAMDVEFSEPVPTTEQVEAAMATFSDEGTPPVDALVAALEIVY